MSENEQFCRRLAGAREQAGLSQWQAAHLLKCEREMIAGWETGMPVSDERMAQFAEVYDVSEEWLRTGTNPDFDLNEYQVLTGNSKFSAEEVRDLLSLFETLRQDKGGITTIARRLSRPL